MRSMVLSALMLTLCALGCNSEPTDKRSDVTGKITLDGVPLTEGAISFDLGDGAVPGNGEIKDGVYSLAAKPGKNKVIIRAFKVDPKIKPSNDPVKPVSNKVNYIPKQYNDKTELTAEVTPDKRTFDFELSNKEK